MVRSALSRGFLKERRIGGQSATAGRRAPDGTGRGGGIERGRAGRLWHVSHPPHPAPEGAATTAGSLARVRLEGRSWRARLRAAFHGSTRRPTSYQPHAPEIVGARHASPKARERANAEPRANVRDHSPRRRTSRGSSGEFIRSWDSHSEDHALDIALLEVASRNSRPEFASRELRHPSGDRGEAGPAGAMNRASTFRGRLVVFEDGFSCSVMVHFAFGMVLRARPSLGMMRRGARRKSRPSSDLSIPILPSFPIRRLRSATG